MRILELTEPFPSALYPTSALFVKEHVIHISKHSELLLCVFTRLLPPKMVFKNFEVMKKWIIHIMSKLKEKRRREYRYEIVFIPYISLPRPWFEFLNIGLLKLFYSKYILRIANEFKPDIIITHWVSPLSLLALKVGKLIEIPVVIDVHEDPDNIKLYFPYLKQIWIKALKLADAIIVHSEVNKNKLINLGIEEMKIFKVHLGINNIFTKNKGEILSYENSKKDNFVIISVAHLSDPRKKIDELLHSFAKISQMYPKIKLIIIGDGRLRKYLEELSSTLGIKEKVDFKGNLAPEGVKNEMSKADLFVLPSIRESFGLVFIEALASGIPVIGYKEAGAIMELEKLGIPVIKLDKVTPDSISNAIKKAINEYEKIKKETLKFKYKAINVFSWDNHAKSYMEILKKIYAIKKQYGKKEDHKEVTFNS